MKSHYFRVDGQGIVPRFDTNVTCIKKAWRITLDKGAFISVLGKRAPSELLACGLWAVCLRKNSSCKKCPLAYRLKSMTDCTGGGRND